MTTDTITDRGELQHRFSMRKVSETYEIIHPGKLKTILPNFLVRKTILNQRIQNAKEQMSQLLAKNKLTLTQ